MANRTWLLLLALGGGALGAPSGEWESAERERSAEAERGARCLGVLGSTRGSIQGLVAGNKTPAERLLEFRNRVEAVRSLVVPPGMRRPATIGLSPPVNGIPLLGQPASAGTGLSILGQPSISGTDLSVLGQPPSSTNGQAILGQPSSGLLNPIRQAVADFRSVLTAPNGAQTSSGAGLPILTPIQQTIANVRSALTAPHGAQTSSGGGLPILSPIRQTIADMRSALRAPNGAQTSLPVSPFTTKQMDSALGIPEGIMKNTADILGMTNGQLGGGTDSILGSPHKPGSTNRILGSPHKLGSTDSILGSPHKLGSTDSILGSSHKLGATDNILGSPHTSGSTDNILGSPHTSGSTDSILGSPHKSGSTDAIIGSPHTPGSTENISGSLNKPGSTDNTVGSPHAPGSTDILGSPHAPESTDNTVGSPHMPDPDVTDAHKQPTFAEILNSAIYPAESGTDVNHLAENHQTDRRESMLPYIPRIPTRMRIPGLIEVQ